jgi:hypothetical protein
MNHCIGLGFLDIYKHFIRSLRNHKALTIRQIVHNKNWLNEVSRTQAGFGDLSLKLTPIKGAMQAPSSMYRFEIIYLRTVLLLEMPLWGL